jgi:hypothetical protein
MRGITNFSNWLMLTCFFVFTIYSFSKMLVRVAYSGEATDNRNREQAMKNFGAVLWIFFLIALLAVGWKGRNTLPLHWGSTGANPLLRLLVAGSLVAIVALYVWWANRRDFK